MPPSPPERYAALTREAGALVEAGRSAEAERVLSDIVALNPREHFAWGLLARLALERGAPAAAVERAEHAARLDRRNASYLNLLAVAHAEAGELERAEAALRRALRLEPAYAEGHYNLGKVLQKRGDLAGARIAYGRAVALAPRYPGARDNLAIVLLRLGDAPGAVEALEAAAADEPDEAWHRVLLGNALAAARGHAAAVACLEEAVRRLPGSATAHRALGHALLGAGELARGWRERALGRETPGAPAAVPPPLPARLDGRRVLLVTDEGLGDALFYLRYVPELEARGARVCVQAPAKLAPLLRASGRFERVVESAAAEAADRAADHAVLLGDLPLALGCDRPVPPLPLGARAELVEGWRVRLAALGPAPHVGITWRAGTDRRRGPEFGRGAAVLFKEIDPALLGRALARGLGEGRGTLVSLQRLPEADETEALARAIGRAVHDLSAVNDDLASALALLAVLDEYVAVSNTNVHLRASAGRASRVLVQFPPEWRWLAGGEASPWFPGSRVYRQSAAGDWGEALARLAADLGAA